MSLGIVGSEGPRRRPICARGTNSVDPEQKIGGCSLWAIANPQRLPIMDQSPTTSPSRDAARKGRILLLLIAAFVLGIIALAAVTSNEVQIRVLLKEGKPRAVAECMAQLGASWSECEVGMFTGTYPAAWDSVPELVRVRDAVRALRTRGGAWSFADTVSGRAMSVCATLPGRSPICASNVQAALHLSLQPTEVPAHALAASPAR